MGNILNSDTLQELTLLLEFRDSIRHASRADLGQSAICRHGAAVRRMPIRQNQAILAQHWSTLPDACPPKMKPTFYPSAEIP